MFMSEGLDDTLDLPHFISDSKLPFARQCSAPPSKYMLASTFDFPRELLSLPPDQKLSAVTTRRPAVAVMALRFRHLEFLPIRDSDEKENHCRIVEESVKGVSTSIPLHAFLVILLYFCPLCYTKKLILKRDVECALQDRVKGMCLFQHPILKLQIVPILPHISENIDALFYFIIGLNFVRAPIRST